MNNTKIITVFSIGLLAGAITGILLAPDSGMATRKKIMRKTGQRSGNNEEPNGDLNMPDLANDSNSVPKMNADIL